MKLKQCTQCPRMFMPQRMGQRVCGIACARRLVNAAKKAEKEDVRRRKADLKTIPELIKEAQTAFNAWVRARDEKEACICCGRFPVSSAGLSGHSWDCGHYRSTGSASHLRFNEDNAHMQLVLCNRYGAGRAVDYRIGLIARIGLARVEALESDNHVHRWTREELIAIKSKYVQKLKDLKKETT